MRAWLSPDGNVAGRLQATHGPRRSDNEGCPGSGRCSVLDGAATNSGSGTDQLGAALLISVFDSHDGDNCTGSPIVTDLPANGPLLPDQPALAVGAANDLCFRATLPADAHTDLQSQESVVTLTLIATSEAP